MTWQLLFSLPVLSLPQDNEAEKLYRNLERKLTAAKTIRFDVVIDSKVAGQELNIRSKVWLTRDNKHRHEAEITKGDKREKITVVLDGVKSRGITDGGLVVPLTTGPDETKVLTGLLLRVGWFGNWDHNPKMDVSALLPASGFKLGPKEDVGKRAAQSVTLAVTLKNVRGDPSVKCTLWLDTETGLPLKRVMEMDGDKRGRVMETYSEFVLDAKMDAKLFIVPD